jgi:hypothetical protein
MSFNRFAGILLGCALGLNTLHAASFDPFDKGRARNFEKSWRAPKKPASLAKEQMEELFLLSALVKKGQFLFVAEEVAALRVVSSNPLLKSAALLLYAALAEQDCDIERATIAAKSSLNDKNFVVKQAVLKLQEILNRNVAPIEEVPNNIDEQKIIEPPLPLVKRRHCI